MLAEHDERGKQASASQLPLEEVELAILETMMLSREADRRENILFRQGRGQFHVSSCGHEALAALARAIRKDDWVFSHYRDRALMLGLGMSLYEQALGYFAKASSSSGGRQMVNHFCQKDLNIVPSATPTGLQCLPAVGLAWGLSLKQKASVVFCSIGDASTRQGEFLEAVAFAIQEKLPVIFVVEDNGYGISTPTDALTPLYLGMLPASRLHLLDGRDPFQLYKEAAPIIEKVRAGTGPQILWIKLDRLTSHTASDEQERYRSAEELSAISTRDPVKIAEDNLIESGKITNASIGQMKEKIRQQVKETYQAAEAASEPAEDSVSHHVFSNALQKNQTRHQIIEPPQAHEWTLVESFRHTLSHILGQDERYIMFGEDIEDPKGGVFGLTKGLSTKYPSRVINSPLSESTIAGLASGLATAGLFPIFELQFIDFMGPAFNQIVNQVSTLRWRSQGSFKCPLIFYAPCGGYIGGGPWHSQTAEGWLAHTPGLKIYMPSCPADASQILSNAAHGDDPSIILLPKNLFQKKEQIRQPIPLHCERARIRKTGEHVTIVAWGNCVDTSLETAEILEHEGIASEVLDLCSISPCDWKTIFSSVRKTGRLVVVQEDNKSCSFGQSIISETMSQPDIWECLYAAPQLVSREDVHIAFNRKLEAATLPNAIKVAQAAYKTLGKIDE